MTPDQIRRARTVIDWLVTAEPRPARIDSEAGWLKAVTNRIRAERWDEVCAAVKANPDLSATTIAERLTGAPVKPIPINNRDTAQAPQPEPWTEPAPDPDAGPVLTPPDVRQRIEAIKEQLMHITKPPIGEAPLATRGGGS